VCTATSSLHRCTVARTSLWRSPRPLLADPSDYRCKGRVANVSCDRFATFRCDPPRKLKLLLLRTLSFFRGGEQAAGHSKVQMMAHPPPLPPLPLSSDSEELLRPSPATKRRSVDTSACRLSVCMSACLPACLSVWMAGVGPRPGQTMHSLSVGWSVCLSSCVSGRFVPRTRASGALSSCLPVHP
jgi:hypothetical protein